MVRIGRVACSALLAVLLAVGALPTLPAAANHDSTSCPHTQNWANIFLRSGFNQMVNASATPPTTSTDTFNLDCGRTPLAKVLDLAANGASPVTFSFYGGRLAIPVTFTRSTDDAQALIYIKRTGDVVSKVRLTAYFDDYNPANGTFVNLTSSEVPGGCNLNDSSVVACSTQPSQRWSAASGTTIATGRLLRVRLVFSTDAGDPAQQIQVRYNGTSTATGQAGDITAGNASRITLGPAGSGAITNTDINKNDPALVWTTPASIPWGTALSGTQLNASEANSLAGSFVYNAAAGEVKAIGSHTLSTTFTPTDTVNYNTATKSVTLTVTKAVTTTTVSCPSSVDHTGQPITPCSASVSGYQLSQALPVTYENHTDEGTATASATYTATSTHLGSSDSKNFEIVQKDDPVITWGNPDAITYGTLLSATQLNATAVPAGGSFSYSPAAGTLLNAGTQQSLTVSYTPPNQDTHNVVSKTVKIDVNKATSTTTVTCPASVTYNGSAQTPCSAQTTGAGGLNASPTVTYENNIEPGAATASASYAESANHLASSDGETFVIGSAPVTVTVADASGVYGGKVTLSATLTSGDTPLANRTLTFKLSDTTVGTAVTGEDGGASLSEVSLAGHSAGTDADAIRVTTPAVSGYAAGDDTGDLEVTKKPVSVTADDKSKVYGEANPTFTYTVEPGLIDGDSLGSVRCSPAGTSANADGHAISCSGAGNGNYDVTYVAGKFVVSPREVTVAAADKSMTYGEAEPTYTFTVGNLASGDTTVAGVSCQAAGVTAGEHDIACSGETDPNYTVTSYTKATLTVSPREVTVAAADKSMTYGDAEPTYTFTVGNLASGDTTVAGVSCQAAGVTAGEHDITCSGETDPNYEVTSYDAGTLTVDKAASTTAVTCPESVPYTGAAQEPCTAKVTGPGSLDQALSVTYADNTAEGTATASASHAESANHLGSSDEETFVIGPAPVTVTVTNASGVYGGTTTLKGTLESDETPLADRTLTFKLGDTTVGTAMTNASGVASLPDVSLLGHAVGTHTELITVSAGAVSGYAAGSGSGDLEVTKRSVTVTAADKSKTYGETDPAFSFSVAGLIEGDTELEGVSCSPAGTSAGDHDIVCSGATDTNYDVTYTKGTFEVSPRTVTVTAADKTKTYGDDDPAFTFTVTNLAEGDTTVAGVTCTTTGTAAGDHAITCSGETDPNYVVEPYEPGTLTVTPRSVTVTAADKAITYGDTAPAFTFTTSNLATDDTTVAGVSCSAAAFTAGSHAITCSGETDANYEVTSYVAGALTVDKAASTTAVTCPASVTYTAAAQEPCTAQVTGPGGLDQALTVTYADNTDVGTATASASHVESANHTASSDQTTFQIKKATGTITWPVPTAIVYGAGLGIDELDATYSLLGECVYTPAAGTVLAAGTHELKVVCTPTDTNYDPSEKTVSLTVSSRAVKVTAVDASKTYGADDPAFTFTVVELAEGDTTVQGVSCAPEASTVGSHAIVCSGETDDNYTVTSYVDGTFTVAPQPVEVTAVNASKTYGEDDPAFTFTVEGLVGDDTTVSGVTCTPDKSAAGVHAIVCSGETDDNYTVTSYVDGTFTVSPRKVVVTADDKTITYGDVTPEFTFTVDDLAEGDSTVAGVVCAPEGDSGDAGTYPIVCTDASDANYEVTEYVDGTYTVKKATPSLTWATPANIVVDTPLSATQLNAVYGGVGTCTYTPEADTVLPVGTHTLSVECVPTDTTNHETVSTTVQLVVVKALNELPVVTIVLECMTAQEVAAYLAANPEIKIAQPQSGDVTCDAADDAPKTDDWLRARIVSATDADDPVESLKFEFDWRVNGVSLQSSAKPGAATSDVYRLDLESQGDLDNLISVRARAHDGTEYGNRASKSVQVGNTASVADDLYVSLPVGTSRQIRLGGSDADFQTLVYRITDLPDHGVLRNGDVPIKVGDELPGYLDRVVYEPNASYVGDDSFAFQAGDDRADGWSAVSGQARIGVYAYGAAGSGNGGTGMSAGTATVANPVTVGVAQYPADPDVQMSVEGVQVNGVFAGGLDGSLEAVEVQADLHITKGADDATATTLDPFMVTFRLAPSLVPRSLPVGQVRVYRNGTLVETCPDGDRADRVAADYPCVADRTRDDATGEVTVLVETLAASAWNFAVPVQTLPVTTIVTGPTGVTNAGSENDPSGGSVEFGYVASKQVDEFDCHLQRGATVIANWVDCGANDDDGSIEFDLSAQSDGMYTFRVRAIDDGETGVAARRDFVVDRTAPEITLTAQPADTITVSTATFSFISDDDEAEFQCQLDLGGWQSCDSGSVTYNGLSNGAHSFLLEASDSAGNRDSEIDAFTVNVPGAGPVDPDPDPLPTRSPEPGPVLGRLVERISGSDRAATAAALARRFFRPGVPVVYIARDDNFPDALTGGPLAGEQGGPILLASPTNLPQVTAETLEWLQPGRIVVLGGTAAVSGEVEAALRPLAPTVRRIAGPDRFATAARISQSRFPQGTDVVFVATGAAFPDALSAGPAAAAADASVLLTSADELPEVTAQELARLRPTRIVLLGGRAAISAAVQAAIEAATGVATERISGAGRYETAAAVSAGFFPAGTPAAFVATGADYADALTAGPIAAILGGPVLLSEHARLPRPTVTELDRMRPEQIFLVGGVGALNESTEEQVRTSAAS